MPQAKPGDLSQPSLGDQPINQQGPVDPLQAQIIQHILQTFSQAPPVAPPRKKHKVADWLMGGSPVYQKERDIEYQGTPEFAQYASKMQQWEAQQKGMGPLAAAAGTIDRGDMARERENRVAGQADMRLMMNRFQFGNVNTIDPRTNVNVTMPVKRDKLTGRLYDNQNNELDERSFTSPIHWQVAYDEFGNAIQLPTSPLPQRGVPQGASAGAPGITTAPQPTEGGQQPQGGGPSNVLGPRLNRQGIRELGFKKIPGTNIQGIQQQLDNADLMLNEMRSNWLQRPPGAARQALGTASANLMSRGIGANLGLSGLASAIDPHAVIHERDREAIATTLSFPLSGSRRGMEGARQSLLGIIPHYTDPPEVWDAFDTQMRQLIANSRRMPWGDNPEGAAQQYENSFDSVLANVSSATTNKSGQYAGQALHRSLFDQLSPGDQQRFVQGGGKVVDQ